jgi:hypothetical protein
LSISFIIITFAANNKQKTMARPIRETPILFGEQARQFEERMKNPQKETPEERKRRIDNYKAALSMLVK